MNIKNFLKKVVVSFVIWLLYTLEALVILVFLDQWLSLPWITTSLEGNPFFEGIGWVIVLVVITLLCAFITEIGVKDDLS